MYLRFKSRFGVLWLLLLLLINASSDTYVIFKVACFAPSVSTTVTLGPSDCHIKADYDYRSVNSE